MRLVKLDAIDSTNDFLKALCNNEAVENYTIVIAAHQLKGKGQMGSSWVSDKGKNLIMSILIKEVLSGLNKIFHLNVAVSIAVVQVLKQYQIPKISVKWPNDIMSGKNKIGGILIENSIKTDGTIISVVGLGLNVNQMNFQNLPNASSLALVTGRTFDVERMVAEMAECIKVNVQSPKFSSNEFWTEYTNLLFKKGIPMPFEDVDKNRFMGIIQGVDDSGKLMIQLENETLKTFNLKEIQMLY